MAVFAAAVKAGVCVVAPAVTLEGHKVQNVICATSGMIPQPEVLRPGGRVAPMHPELLERG